MRIMFLGLFLLSCDRQPPAPAEPPAPTQAHEAQHAPPVDKPADKGAEKTATTPTAREVPIAADQPTIEITVDERGYVPATVSLEKGKATHIKIKRVFEQTCADGIVVPAAKINKPLPTGKTVEFAIIADADTPFGCPMGMMIAGTFKVK